MLCSSLSRDYCRIDEKSLEKQPSMSSGVDSCRLDNNVEKFVKKQPSKRLWSDLFKTHCRLDDARDWSTMLVEILEQISDRLPLLDFVSFRSACKQWLSSPSSRAELLNFSKDHPWLVLYDLDRNKTGIPKCYVYSQSRSQCCTFKLYGIEGATIVESKFDWVLAHHGQFFFLYNPLTFVRIDLPKLNIIKSNYSCTFTYRPTRGECVVYVVNRNLDSSLNLSVCRVGDKNWHTQSISDVRSIEIGRRMRVSTCDHSSKNLCGDLCPSAGNRMLIYDPEKNNETWYEFSRKKKVFVLANLRGDGTTAYEVGRDKLITKLKEMILKHEKEWWQRSGGRDIEVTVENMLPGTLAMGHPHPSDEAVEFDVVNGSLLELKSTEIWFRVSWD